MTNKLKDKDLNKVTGGTNNNPDPNRDLNIKRGGQDRLWHRREEDADGFRSGLRPFPVPGDSGTEGEER